MRGHPLKHHGRGHLEIDGAGDPDQFPRWNDRFLRVASDVHGEGHAGRPARRLSTPSPTASTTPAPLHAGSERRRDRIGSGPHVDVDEVHPACRDPDAGFSRSRRGRGRVPKPQHLCAADLLNANRPQWSPLLCVSSCPSVCPRARRAAVRPAGRREEGRGGRGACGKTEKQRAAGASRPPSGRVRRVLRRAGGHPLRTDPLAPRAPVGTGGRSAPVLLLPRRRSCKLPVHNAYSGY